MAGGIPDYDELKIRVEPGQAEATYNVLAFGPEGSIASGTFTSPFTKIELDNFILRVGLPRRSVRSFRSSQMEEAKRFGAMLFDALVKDDIREAYVSARQALTRGRGLRLTLQLTNVPELMEIPWEFLYERPAFLSQSIYSPIVRSLDLKSVRPPWQLGLPLRILGVVSSPRGLPPLDVAEERRKLEQALSSLTDRDMVELIWLGKATLRELDRVVGAPDELHIFHYIGHGAYDARTGGGLLMLENDRGDPHEVTGEELGSLLQDEHSLALAVLNSCEGARTSHADTFSGVASSLVECGIPAVVGMQFEVTDTAAITFAEQLYSALTQGFPIDAALARARKAIWAAGHDVEFGTPVLFLRSGATRLFEIDTTTPPKAVVPPRLRGAPAAPPEPDHPSEDAATPDEEALYDQALAAFWTEQWDQAVKLLRHVSAQQHNYPDAAEKLDIALRQQQLATQYGRASAAAKAGDWEQAIAEYTLITNTDPDYRDTKARLANAHRQQQLTNLRTEAHRLHQAGHWSAVLKVGEQLQALDPTAADPDGLMSSARGELTASEQAAQLAGDYASALQLIDAGQWQQAVTTLEQISQLNPAYRAAPALLARARREAEKQARRDVGVLLRRLLESKEQARQEPSRSTPSQPRQEPSRSTPAQPRQRKLRRGAAPVQTVRHVKAVRAVAFSGDGRWLATGSDDKTAQIWLAMTGAPGTRVRHSGWLHWVSAVAFSPDGRWLATGSHDTTARIWDSTSGKELLKVTHTNAVVTAVAFSPDSRWLATGSYDKTARIWDSTSGKELLKVTHNSLMVNAVAFSPDSRRLATGSNDKTARIWDSTTGKELLKVTHDDVVYAVTFSPDGRWLATGSHDKTARIWSSTSGKELLKVTHEHVVYAVTLSPDGRWLATGSHDKTARIWALEEYK
jgi:tetratricopeptide (TPR) repeat protein